MESLTFGKLRGLEKCATSMGAIAVLALDHRNNLRRALNPVHPEMVTSDSLSSFKIEVTKTLAPYASAVLLDPEVGAFQAIASGVLPGSVGLVVALEATGYTGDPSARGSRILDNWSVEKARRMGADAVKLLVYYHPDSQKATEIEELVTHPELYVGKKVVITGIVSRTLDGHPYIQDGLFGVYLFKGYAFTTKLAEGNEIILSGLTPTYYPNIDEGGLQLTGFTRENIEVLSTGNVVTPIDKLITEISLQDVGSLLKIYDLTVISIYISDEDDSFTVTVEDALGNIITIRRDDSVSMDITPDLFVVGTKFDIVAPLGRYDSKFQLMITSLDDVTFK